jgi:hypothetical protein
MARFNSIINSFSSGEVSPRLYGRTDLDSYKKSLKELLNMYITPQGGARRRPGSVIVYDDLMDRPAPTNSAQFPRFQHMVPFIVSSTEKYMILFAQQDNSDAYQFWAYNPDDDLLFQVATISVSGSFASFQEIFIADPRELSYTQVGDLIFFAHSSVNPFYFARIRRNYFTVQGYYIPTDDLANPILNLRKGFTFPVRDMNTVATHYMSIVISGVTATITSLKDTVIPTTKTEPFFTEAMVGTTMAFQDSGSIGYVHIRSITSSSIAVGDILDVGNVPPAAFISTTLTVNSSQWYQSAWQRDDFPNSVASYKGALIFGGNKTFPDTIWKSQDFDLFEMMNDRIIDPAQAIVASDPTNYSIGGLSGAIGEITWMKTKGQDLIIGLSGQEITVKNIMATSIPDVSPQTTYGVEKIEPIFLENKLVFVQRGFSGIRDYVFDFNTNGYISKNLTITSEHLRFASLKEINTIGSIGVSPTIQSIMYAKYPNNLMLVSDNYGYIYGATIDVETGTVAWGRTVLGGTSIDTPYGKVISIASLPSSVDRGDEIYFVVERQINGTARRTIEKMAPIYTFPNLNTDSDDFSTLPVYVDSATIYRTKLAPKFWATLTNDDTAEVVGATGSGARTGISNAGHFSFLRKRMDVINIGGTSFVKYASIGLVDFSTQFTIGFTLHKHEVGGFILSINKTGNDNNKIEISTIGGSITSGITLNLFSSTGVSIFSGTVVDMGSTLTTSTVSRFTGNSIKIEIAVDLVGNSLRGFLNGILNTSSSISGVRTSDVDELKLFNEDIHTNGLGLENEGGLSNVFFHDSILHTASFVPHIMQDKSTTIRNLHYLQGETVAVLGDGNDLGTFTVTALGTIELKSTYDTVIVGLPYTHRLETLPVEAGGNLGNAQGEIKRIDEVVARFQDTASCKFGPNKETLDEIPFRDNTDPLDKPLSLFTGDKVLEFDGDYESNASIVLEDNKPLPCNVTAIIYKGITYG